MSLRSSILAASALFAAANAHMQMSFPVPYAKDKVTTSPITPSTSNMYPCQFSNGFTFDSADVATMAVGSSMTVNISGSANHGGGGCQLSVAEGRSPTASTKFKVVATIEGCPAKGPDQLTFKIPDDLMNGDHTFAWTWNSRLSGGPELYMNCAPVKITGGQSDTTKFDALPDILVANIGEGCTTVADMEVQYPNPGQQVIQEASSASFALPTGTACGAAVSGGSPASTGAAGGGGASTAAPVASSVAVVSSAVASSNGGGVFAPSAGSAAQSTMTTLVTVTAVPSTPAEATSVAAAPSSAAASGTASPSGSTGGGGATCSTNGAVVCNGPTQFGLCNNGNVVWQDVAAGTTCSNGSITKRTMYNRQLKGRVARPRVVPGQDFTPDA